MTGSVSLSSPPPCPLGWGPCAYTYTYSRYVRINKAYRKAHIPQQTHIRIPRMCTVSPTSPKGDVCAHTCRSASGTPAGAARRRATVRISPPVVCDLQPDAEGGLQRATLFETWRNRVGEALRCPHEKAKQVAMEIKPRSSPRSGQGLAPRGRRRRSPLNLHRRRWSPSSATTRRHLVCPRRPPSMLTSRTRRGRPAVEARTCVLRST